MIEEFHKEEEGLQNLCTKYAFKHFLKIVGTGVSHVVCVKVVEEVLELLGYGRCESYWGRCESC